MKIVELMSHRGKEYKDFFIQGLAQDEDNFRITPGDELDAPFPTRDKKDSFTLGAYVKDLLAGVVSFTRDGSDREKLRHKGILFRMYVGKEFRGHGIARKLIEEVVNRVEKIQDIEQINLAVVSTNSNAKALYEKIGFKVFGTENKAIKWRGKYFDEDQMFLRLARTSHS
jgi:RimJ/RimL family protein N-acetyltransferase